MDRIGIIFKLVIFQREVMKRPIDPKSISKIIFWIPFALPLIALLKAALTWMEASAQIQTAADTLFIIFVLALIAFNIYTWAQRKKMEPPKTRS